MHGLHEFTKYIDQVFTYMSSSGSYCCVIITVLELLMSILFTFTAIVASVDTLNVTLAKIQVDQWKTLYYFV